METYSHSRIGSLDRFVAHAPSAMAMFDREMRYIAASPGWLQDYGLPAPPVGRSHYDVFPEIGEAWKAVHRRCLAGATERSESERFDRADGRVQWLRWEVRPWLDEGGAIGGIVIASADITVQVEAQQEAAAQARRAEAAERRLNEAIDALPLGFSLYDPNDRLVVSNKATRAMYPESADQIRPGASFEHLVSISFDRGDYGYEVADRERWLEERMERHRNPCGAIEQLTHSGRWLRIEERKTPDGGTVVIRTDVTDLKTGKEELARRNALLEDAARRAEAAERRLTEAIEVIPGGFLIYDADDRLVVCNEAARAMYSALADVLRPGAHFEDIVRAGYVRLYGPAGADWESWIRERRERRRNPSGALEQKIDGGRWLRVEERRMSDGGLVALRTDITDLKNRQRELAEKNALLEATLHSMGEGIAVFGPDLRLLATNEKTGRLLQLPPALLEPGASFEDIMRFRVERGDYGETDVDSQVEYRVSRFQARKPWSDMRRRPDGRVFETRFDPMPDGGGVFMFRDVTEQAEYEAKLIEKAALLEATLHNMGEGIAAFDADLKLSMINDFAVRMGAVPLELARPGIAYEDILRFAASTEPVGESADPAGESDVESFVASRMARVRAQKPFLVSRRLEDGRVIEIRFSPAPDGGAVFLYRDVTERVEQEAKLSEKTAQLEATFQNIGEGIAVFGPDLKLLTFNKLAAQLVDTPPELSRPGVSFEELTRFCAERGDYGDVDVEASVRERTAEFRLRRTWIRTLTLGERAVIEVRFNPMPDGGGIYVYRDVTERVEQGARLSREHSLLEATLRNMGEGIAAFDTDLKLLVMNEYAVRMGGLPPELARSGASYEDILRFLATTDPAGESNVEPFVDARVAQFRAQKPFLITRRLKDGRVIETRFNPTPDGGGVFVYRDVTERAEYQAKLAERTALLEATLQNMGEGIAAFDPDRRLLIANETAVHLLRLPPALGQPGASFDDMVRFRSARGDPDFGGGDVEAHVAERAAWFREPKPFVWTRRLFDGRTIDTRFNPTSDGGAVIVYRDVTERADYIAKLADALASAEQASRAKSEFLATASHELRTPMNAIIGLSGLLRESDLAETERRYAEMIEGAGESLLVIIDDLLEFASLEGRTPALEAAPFDPRALAGQAIAIACPPERTARLSILTDIDPAVPCALVGDGGRIRRILVNLLDNAVKHTAEGTVTVRARARPLDGAETTMLRIEVEDTGEGFPQSEAARLFEPFERGAMTDRTRAAGLGLGLAICRRLADLMGGTIGAESAPGAGSRFWFEVPLRAGAPLPPGETVASHPADERRALNVLVVEDVEANRDLTRAMLERLGHEAHCAEDGAEAIDAVRKGDYDVILMDIQMPNVDGLEATRAIRAMGGRRKDVPIIAVSAFSRQSDRDAAFAAGVSGFLSKPLRRSELDGALRSLRFASGIWPDPQGRRRDEGAP